MTDDTPRILIGTSGWSYPHWKGPFYPPGLSHEAELAFYAEHFQSVELNNSFYRLPTRHTMEHWRDQVPEDFVFTVKASRFITHMKKLKDPGDSLPPFFERITALENKLGPVLFQLPPHWHLNLERLAGFLSKLSRDYRYAFEFRDPSWHTDDVYELLARYGAAFCIFDLAGQLSPLQVTTDWVYIRLHGPEGPYQGRYDDATLSHWADTLCRWVQQRKTVYCFFDNDEAGYAPRDAERLQVLVQQ